MRPGKHVLESALAATYLKATASKTAAVRLSHMPTALPLYLGLIVSRLTDYHSSLTTWASNPQMEILRNLFARQAIAMAWISLKAIHLEIHQARLFEWSKPYPRSSSICRPVLLAMCEPTMLSPHSQAAAGVN